MEYKYVDEKGIEIKAELEKWIWGVVYKDGTELKQFGDDGLFHRFAEIKQEDVVMFSMYKPDDADLKKRIDIEVKDGMKLFHFYRNIVLDYMSENKRKIKIYVFGWKNEKGLSYNYILPDDRIVMSNEDIDVSKYNI